MMLIHVHVVTNAKSAKITKISEDRFEARIDAKPQDGQANARLLELMAKHLSVKKGDLKIVKGIRSREKVLSLSERGSRQEHSEKG